MKNTCVGYVVYVCTNGALKNYKNNCPNVGKVNKRECSQNLFITKGYKKGYMPFCVDLDQTFSLECRRSR